MKLSFEVQEVSHLLYSFTDIIMTEFICKKPFCLSFWAQFAILFSKYIYVYQQVSDNVP